jgi:hypothetical protein
VTVDNSQGSGLIGRNPNEVFLAYAARLRIDGFCVFRRDRRGLRGAGGKIGELRRGPSD